MRGISFVIPVHNSFQLLKRGLESLEHFPKDRTEIVIVDDCSTDDTYARLKEYAKKSEQDIKVISNPNNLGPGTSRNIGVQNATREYVCFLDSDDYYSREFLGVIFPLLDFDYDCIVFDAKLESPSGNLSYLDMFFQPHTRGLIPTKEAIVGIRSGTMGKVYKRSIVVKNGIEFLPQFRCEDEPFVICSIANCKTIFYCKEPLYVYVQQANSLIHNASLTDPLNIENSFNYIKNKIEWVFPEELGALFIRDIVYSETLQIVSGLSRSEFRNYANQVEYRYPNYLCNAYLQKEKAYVRLFVYLFSKRKLVLLKVVCVFKRIYDAIVYRTR